jgi:hypothetical protein
LYQPWDLLLPVSSSRFTSHCFEAVADAGGASYQVAYQHSCI